MTTATLHPATEIVFEDTPALGDRRIDVLLNDSYRFLRLVSSRGGGGVFIHLDAVVTGQRRAKDIQFLRLPVEFFAGDPISVQHFTTDLGTEITVEANPTHVALSFVYPPDPHPDAIKTACRTTYALTPERTTRESEVVRGWDSEDVGAESIILGREVFDRLLTAGREACREMEA